MGDLGLFQFRRQAFHSVAERERAGHRAVRGIAQEFAAAVSQNDVDTASVIGKRFFSPLPI